MLQDVLANVGEATRTHMRSAEPRNLPLGGGASGKRHGRSTRLRRDDSSRPRRLDQALAEESAGASVGRWILGEARDQPAPY